MPRRTNSPPFDRGDTITCSVDWYSTLRQGDVVQVHRMRRARQFPHRWVVEVDMGYAINCYYASNFKLYRKFRPQYVLPFDEPQQGNPYMPDYTYSTETRDPRRDPNPTPDKGSDVRIHYYALLLTVEHTNESIHRDITESVTSNHPRAVLIATNLADLMRSISDFDKGKGSPSRWAVFDLQGVLEGTYRYEMKDTP